MLVLEDEDGVVLVRQREHARVSGLMANEAEVSVPDTVRLAIRHHDDGWEEYDQGPRFDESGELIDYRSVPLPEHLDILERSVQRCREKDPYAGWLVSRHGCSFHEGKTGEPVEGFLQQQEQLRREIEETLEHHEDTRTRHFDWLQFTDALSLYVLDPWSEEWTWKRTTPGSVTVRRTDEHRYRYEGAGFDPGTHRFSFRFRRIPSTSADEGSRAKRDYESAGVREGTVTLSVRD